jgi:AAA+ ATPase superfamily predicted ATPase
MMTRFREFKGRRHELALLDSLGASTEASFLVLYGRRRVGKTRLLTHWLKQIDLRGLYWVAEPSSTLDQLRSFSQALYNFANPTTPAPADFTYATWAQVWQQVGNLAREERLVLIVDEFTYLLDNDPGLAGVMQNAWDQQLENSNLFLIISGSHLGMMQRQVLSYQAPLYGRATRQSLLQPFTFGATSLFFPDYSADERVTLSTIFGGIPAYWERIDPTVSVFENIRSQLLTADNLMQAEPRLLLQDFVRDPHNYVSIFRAIATGARTQKEISARSGLAQGHVSKYASVLREAGFVERRIPVTATGHSRSGRYHISDPYLRFYYRFLSARQAQLALNIQEPALAEIKRFLPNFIGSHTWEELSREWVLRAGATGQLPFLVDQVGSAWTRDAQVDVVGINRMDKTIVLGECKWQARAPGRAVLQDLIVKTSEVVPKKGQWRVFYLGFSRSGWTAAAHAFAEELAAAKPAQDNWTTAGMQLLNLKHVDNDLTRWYKDAA